MNMTGIEALELGEAYQAELTRRYGNEALERVDAGLGSVELPHREGETLTTLRLQPDTPIHDRRVLYVPGFTEDVLPKIPFALELEKLGLDVTFLGQNRRGISRNASGRPDATYSQAVNNLAVLEAAGLQDGPVDPLLHSYASLIFQAMMRETKERGRSTFDDSRVVMLAPAGSNPFESPLTLGPRFGRHGWTESRTDKDFPDPDGVMLKAGIDTFTANWPRSIREMLELSFDRVNYPWLLDSGISSLAILGYGGDKLFPHRTLKRSMQKMTNHAEDKRAEADETGVDDIVSVQYATPIDYERRKDRSEGESKHVVRNPKNASHNDEQFHPSRVAGSVAQLLRLAAA